MIIRRTYGTLFMRFILLTILFVGMSISAQDTTSYEVITSSNMLRLQPVHQLDFSDDFFVPAINPNSIDQPLDANFDIGWFVYSSPADRFLLLDNIQTLHAAFSSGATTFSVERSNVIDAVAFDEAMFAVLLTGEDGYQLWYEDFNLYGGISQRMRVESDNIPAAIWITCQDDANEGGQDCHANIEVNDGSISSIVTFPPLTATGGEVVNLELVEGELAQSIYTPAQDDEAVVRIGRIPLPYVVTSSLDGLVKLWNIEAGELLYEVDNSTGEPSVFGNINADAAHLVWRDNANQSLYLLDFETGENRFIDNLDGAYAQWYFLSNDASAIIAVNLGGEPNVVVWDTATGERTDLGNYRNCERPQPDMARLSEDGTTLIIGCDTGLDIWRITKD